MNKLFLILILLTCSLSCQKKNYTKEDCEILSMKAYKSLPKEAHLFKKFCGGKKLHYTKRLCQTALQDLIVKVPEKELKKRHGSQIMHCFSQNDLKKFLFRPSKSKD
ncbi:MAG: hypothetical protein HN509_13915 [Halobacteriovoraceae bacterium]|nr:hypothetical protein [Halobacteriovoraceae bacterium]